MEKPIGYGERLSYLAQLYPQRIAVHIDDGSKTSPYTFLQLDQAANSLARFYLQKGVCADGAGDIITIALPNSYALLVAMLAAWKIGAIPNPVSSSMPESERESIIACAQSALLVGRNIIGVDVSVEQVLNTEEDNSPLPILLEHSHERALASGGSTGKPKLILPKNLAVFDPELISGLFKPEKIILVAGPLYHAVPFSSTWQTILNGCTAVVMEKFNAERCLFLIEQYQVDRAWFVPTMMLRIWKLGSEEKEKYNLNSLKNILSGGAPMPAWLMQCWIDWLGAEKLYDVFGPSERIGGTIINGVEWLQHKGSVGKPLPNAQIKIFNETERECKAGEMGEIFALPATGQGSTYEYRSAKGEVKPKNKTVVHEGGDWESVGDMGYLDEDGYLYLGDRKSDMFLSRGRNIYPAEIEAAIQEYDCVRTCAVIGLPEEDGANRIHAVVDAAGQKIDKGKLESFLQDKLTPYKIPQSFEFVDALLRNDAGKVRRSALRAERLSTVTVEN